MVSNRSLECHEAAADWIVAIDAKLLQANFPHAVGKVGSAGEGAASPLPGGAVEVAVDFTDTLVVFQFRAEGSDTWTELSRSVRTDLPDDVASVLGPQRVQLETQCWSADDVVADVEA